MVAAQVLETCIERCEGSSPSERTNLMAPSSKWNRIPGFHPGRWGFESPWRFQFNALVTRLAS